MDVAADRKWFKNAFHYDEWMGGLGGRIMPAEPKALHGEENGK
jgi:hypothetical protein